MTDCEFASARLFVIFINFNSRYFQKPYANDWQTIEAVLRLSTKYFVERLHHRCISRITVDWPMSLENWDVRERDAIDSEGKYSPRLLSPHPVLLINLARELDGIAFSLPAALYDLSRYGPKKIVSGSIAPCPLDFSESCTLPPSPPQKFAHLSSQDLLQVLTGREHGQRFMTAFVEHTLRSPPISPQCCNKDVDQSQTCGQSFYYIMLNTLRSIGGIALGRDADPLFTLSQAEGMLDRTDFCDGTDPKVMCTLNVCVACKASFSTKVKEARADVWRLIPNWFGLPTYEELKKD